MGPELGGRHPQPAEGVILAYFRKYPVAVAVEQKTMKILVANLGSTSFKYQLLDMDGERRLARGSMERIGSPESHCTVEIGGTRREKKLSMPDHAEAVRQCLAQLTDPDHGCLNDGDGVSAIGFKAVVGGRVGGVQRVTADILEAMQEAADIAPAHNPAYIAAMRMLAEKMPHIPLVAAFETDFHCTIPDGNRYYAIPFEWAEKALVRRWGYHGASHRYIAVRSAELFGRSDLRVISCHLGGSNSVCAIRGGRSVACSFGFSAQTGLPHINRVGDFDPFALPAVMKLTGKSLAEVLAVLSSKSGLLGLSGTSGDFRDLMAAVDRDNARAKLTLEVFAASVRHYLGAYLVELGGADAIVFTGGIGENEHRFRAMVLRDLAELGIMLDPAVNKQTRTEAPIHSPASRVQIWVVPTNEELIVARLTKRLLEGS
jgi:acetate kinase